MNKHMKYKGHNPPSLLSYDTRFGHLTFAKNILKSNRDKKLFLYYWSIHLAYLLILLLIFISAL